MYTVLESADEHKARMHSHVERADAEQLSLMLSPDSKLSIHIAVRDLDSRAEFDTSFDFTAKDFHGANAAMSDMMIYRSRHGMRVVPSIGPDVSHLAQYSASQMTSPPQSGLFAELYNLPPDSTLGVVTEIFHRSGKDESEDTQVIQRATTTIHTAHSNETAHTSPPSIPETPLFETISFDELWTGRYILKTYILPSIGDTSLTDPALLEKRALTHDSRKIIVSSAHGIPIAAADLDQAIDQLRIIATGDEWDSLSRATSVDEKRQCILHFWKNRMQARPGDRYSGEAINRPMQVFYSRIEYANAHFGTGFEPGWKSDRGHVYLALGQPDFIDSHPYETMQKPYEIWEYSSLHAKYYFVDQYMMGDFRLTGMGPAPGTFIWDR
jgi:GWxTD domain-containing protein